MVTMVNFNIYILLRVKSPLSWNSPGKNIGMGSRFLLQEIFLTEGSNPGLLHCRQILYHQSHQGESNCQIPKTKRESRKQQDKVTHHIQETLCAINSPFFCGNWKPEGSWMTYLPFFFFFFAIPGGVWDLNSQTRN